MGCNNSVSNKLKPIKRRRKAKSKRRRRAKSTNTKIASFNLGVVNNIKKDMKTLKGGSIKDNIKGALQAARKSVKNIGGKTKIKLPRVIRVPKHSEILLLISIFEGLSVLGALAYGASPITKSVVTARDAKNKLKEAKRHNETMEAIALGNSKGHGLYNKSYKTRYGLYLKKMPKIPYKATPSTVI